MAEYVRHKNDPDGVKYEIVEMGYNKSERMDWFVRSQDGTDYYYLPRADYIKVPAPEKWVDVTGECTIVHESSTWAPNEYSITINHKDKQDIMWVYAHEYKFELINGAIRIKRKES